MKPMRRPPGISVGMKIAGKKSRTGKNAFFKNRFSSIETAWLRKSLIRHVYLEDFKFSVWLSFRPCLRAFRGFFVPAPRLPPAHTAPQSDPDVFRPCVLAPRADRWRVRELVNLAAALAAH